MAKPKPNVLDDENVDACTKTYTNQAFYIECHERQGAKWLKEAVTEQQKNDTQKFLDKCKELRGLNKKILSLLTELRKGTINRILEMDDAELGLRFMMGNIKTPE